jgi:hypothetical protein
MGPPDMLAPSPWREYPLAALTIEMRRLLEMLR